MSVNHRSREAVLAILRSAREENSQAWTSGEHLADRLGVSRVAVWKALASLREAGYPVASSSRGYRLDGPGPRDALMPWEFPGRTGHIHRWERTDSTMERARELALRGETDGSLALAEYQEAGRGRHGRSWTSSEGGLFFTIVKRPPLAAHEYMRAVMGMQLACARAIEKETKTPIRLSWPNDLLAGGRKIAGILPEFLAKGDLIDWINLGVGINLHTAPEGAAACAQWNPALERKTLLAAILEELDAADIASFTTHELSAACEARLDAKGEKVRLIAAGHGPAADTENVSSHTPRGIFLGLDSLGRCRIETAQGVREYSPAHYSIEKAPGKGPSKDVT